MMMSIYSEMIQYHFTVDWYDFYLTDIVHDFTAKNKIKHNISFYKFLLVVLVYHYYALYFLSLLF